MVRWLTFEKGVVIVSTSIKQLHLLIKSLNQSQVKRQIKLILDK